MIIEDGDKLGRWVGKKVKNTILKVTLPFEKFAISFLLSIHLPLY